MAVDTNCYLSDTANQFLSIWQNESQVTNLYWIAERMEGKMSGFVVMGFVSAAKWKIDIKDAIALSYRILLNQQVLSSKTKIMLKSDNWVELEVVCITIGSY